MIKMPETPNSGDDFILHDDGFRVNRITKIGNETSQLSDAEITQLKKYVDLIVGDDRKLSLDEAVQKLANQWRAAAWKIANALRTELHTKRSLTEQNWQSSELTNFQLVEIGKTYGIPFCIYHIGTSNDSGHFILLTSVPQKKQPSDTEYSATAYDPLRGPIEVKLSETDLKRSEKLILNIVRPKAIAPQIHGLEHQLALIKQIVQETKGYDLQVPQYPEVPELSLAKMEPLQTQEGYNCGLWCLIYAMTTMAYKRGENIFKEMGWSQIANLCQVALVTPENG